MLLKALINMVLLIGVKKVELDKEIQMSNKPKKDI
jgi:hypothetical protein